MADENEIAETAEEQRPEAAAMSGTGGGVNLLSPEAIIMLSTAGLLDSVGIILVVVGLDDFGITDFSGMLIIGGWMFFHSLMRGGGSPIEAIKSGKTGRGKAVEGIKSGAPKAKAGANKWVKKMKWLRPVLIVGEIVPYLGTMPCWLILVYGELQSN
jgi:hypothetical protein